MKRLTACGLLLAACLGAVPAHIARPRANGSFAVPDYPLLPGSVVPISIAGVPPPYDVALLGPGKITKTQYYAPAQAQTDEATLIASGKNGAAMHTFAFAVPPNPSTSFLAVATYEDGLILHHLDRAHAPFAVLGIGGAPSDVSIGADGTIAAGTTNAATMTIATLAPWNVRTTSSVPFVDEVALDSRTGSVFVTNRDTGTNGLGALTKIAPDGTTTQRILGQTDEGIAIDVARRRVYVANVNDGTISIVNADTMVEEKRFKAVARVFSLALSPDGKRLYATSNQGVSTPFAAPGSAIAIDVTHEPRVVARSRALAFPIGIAVSEDGRHVYVTDEHDNAVDVLDSHTLAAERPALATCATPWKPLVDRGLLYIPCARDSLVDVFETRTYTHARGAPFKTGGYPLAVAVWHGDAPGNTRRSRTIP